MEIVRTYQVVLTRFERGDRYYWKICLRDFERETSLQFNNLAEFQVYIVSLIHQVVEDNNFSN